jgi:itaconate CoA-transferase
VASSALAGVRVLALEQAAAGPFATHLLADMGAEVVKIERPGEGDVIRTWDGAVRGLSSGYVWLNRRKRSVAIDAASPEGHAIVRRLARASDVFLTNFSPGAVERLGLGYATLGAEDPRLVYCAVTGYGQDGPYHEAKAYDLLIQGEAGIIATTGYPDKPAKVGIPITDIAAGMYAALGIVLAIHQRERTGVGQLVDVSMFESILEWLGYFPHHYWHQGAEPERVGMRHHYIVPYGPYLARDGRYVNVVVGSPRDWERFCRDVIARPELVADERFADAPARLRNRAALEGLIEEILASEDADTWSERLERAGLAHGLVRGIAEVLAHPQVAARRLIRMVESPVGTVPTIESALRLSNAPVATGPIPSLGGDTDDVLRGLGYTEREITSFRERKVIA